MGSHAALLGRSFQPALGAECPLAASLAQRHDVPGLLTGNSAQAALVIDDRGVGDSSEEPSAVVAEVERMSTTAHLVGTPDASRHLGVLVGSDDPFTRQAFRSGATAPGIDVLAEGTVTAVAEQLAAALEPDVVVLDVQTAAAHALCAIQQIRASVPRTRILACSEPAGTEFGLLCLSTGAWGYVSKAIDLAVLPRILRALADGEAVIPRALGTELVRRFTRPDAVDQPKEAQLSLPECRLIELLSNGLTSQEAAAELRVKPATARRHFGSARRKLSVPPLASNQGAVGGRRRSNAFRRSEPD